MKEVDENISQNNRKRVSQNIVYNKLNKKRESLMVQKGREFFKNKKAISMRNSQKDDDKKINININNNINISTNINGIKQNNDSPNYNTIRPKTLENNIKIVKFNNYLEKAKSNILKIKEDINNDIDNKVKEKENKNNNGKSSKKMNQLLLKQLKNESKNEKQEQYIEFYINNNKKNKLYYNLKDNTISTTKYNIFTFIPKGLLYQFSRLSNVYFLFTAIIQSIPLISPLTSLTAIIPLIFVLGVSMIREAIEDLARNNYDNLNNEEEIIVYRNNKFIKSISKTLRVGEVILVY